MKVKNTGVICYLLTLLVSLQQGNVKKSKKSIKIVNIEGENLQIFWTTWEDSMKLSVKSVAYDNNKNNKKTVLPSL